MKSIVRLFFPTVFMSLVLLAALTGGACNKATRETESLDAQSRDRAEFLFGEARSDWANGDLELAAQRARDLVNNYPAFERADEATYVAGEITYELGRFAEAATYFEAVAKNYRLSPLRPAAEVYAARAYAQLGMNTKSAETLIQVLDTPLDAGIRETAETELRLLVRSHLSPSELESIAAKYPSSPINREIAVALARQKYALGDYDSAYELLAEYLYRFPEESDATEARRLLNLAAEKRQPPLERPPGPGIVDPNTVGAVLPVTGPLSLYGRYFEEGLRMAVEEFNRDSARQVKMVTSDSKGTPVDAVKAVRKLVSEEGAIGIVGSVFSVPTIGAAIEANAWRAPLLSPIAPTDGLLEIGPWIFETRVPQEVEVVAIADVAVTRLLHERVAIVAPERGRRREAADLFADEARRFGAEVVAAVYYEEGATDFREQLETVREAAPDAIFIPGDVEELLNLLPQVKFYDLQIQLLGLSNWNNDNLLRLYKDELEGALFPQETYHGKDPEVYQRLLTTLTEKGTGDVSDVTVAGYFGMRLILDSIASGAADRDGVRAYLDAELNQGAEQRMLEAETLTILIVRSGKVREFTPPPRPETKF
jgi:branched-chain amino acid transport system substrate-binding protein